METSFVYGVMAKEATPTKFLTDSWLVFVKNVHKPKIRLVSFKVCGVPMGS